MERLAQIILVAFALGYALLDVGEVQADERVFSEYIYDEVGNIIARRQDKSGAAPAVDSVSPSTVRQNQTVRVTLDGQGLRGAQLVEQTASQSNGSLSFSDIVSTNEQLEFTLGVAEDAAQGPTQVSVSTGLGTTFFSLNVLQELPDLRVSPTPIVLIPSQVLSLNVSLSDVDTVDHDVSVLVSDTSVLTLSSDQIRFDQGSRFPTSGITIAAQGEGVASLRFTSETLGDETYTVRVSNDSYDIAPGSEQAFNSDIVGIDKLVTPPPPDAVELGPIVSELRVNRLFTAPLGSNTTQLYSSSLGVLKGRYHQVVSPKAVGAGQQNVSMVVTGSGLAATDDLVLEPSENTQISNLLVATDGEQITFNLSVDAGTPLSLRKLTLSDPQGVIPSVNLGDDRIYVGGTPPVIESMSPIYFNRGDVRTVTVRGSGLESVRGVTFDDNENLKFSPPVIADDGRSLTFSLSVIGFARLGPRSITLESLLGDSIAQHDAANIISLEDSPPNVLTPVISGAVGLVKESVAVVPQREIGPLSTAIGVSKGATALRVSPSVLAVGTQSQTIEVFGHNLDDVTTVQTIPADGLMLIGPAVISADGSKVTFSATVEPDASQTARRIELIAANSIVPFIEPANSQLSLVGDLPIIDSLTPIQQPSGADFTMTITGINFVDVQSVQATPANGIEFGDALVAPDGRSLTVPVQIDSAALSGQTVITVTTVSGLSSSVLMPENSFTVTN